MRNERGNVIALVLLILAVVSLVGAGALLMSRYDLKFTAAMKSYDKGFNLADGAATICFRDLAKRDREQSLTNAAGDKSAITSDFVANPPLPKTIYCHCLDPANCTTAAAKATCQRCFVDTSGNSDKTVGDYDVRVQIVDYDTNITHVPGYEDAYKTYWNGQGVASRGTRLGTAAFDVTNATVETNVLKMQPK